MFNVIYCGFNEVIWFLYKICFILFVVDLIELYLIICIFIIVIYVIFIYMYLYVIKVYMNDIEYNFVFNVVKWNIFFFIFMCVYLYIIYF